MKGLLMPDKINIESDHAGITNRALKASSAQHGQGLGAGASPLTPPWGGLGLGAALEVAMVSAWRHPP